MILSRPYMERQLTSWALIGSRLEIEIAKRYIYLGGTSLQLATNDGQQ